MFPKMRRGGVVVSPARLPVVAAAGVNAKMGPASRVQRIGGLVPAQGAAPVAVEPDGEPGAGWLVVQNNRVAKGIGKWALTAGGGDAGEGGAAVGGDDTPEKLTKVGASRIVEGDDTWSGLSGLAVVNVSDCVMLGSGLGAGDQVDVRGTIRQGARGDGSSFWISCEKALAGGSCRATPSALAAGNHDESGPEVLHLVDALLVNRGTVKSRRKSLGC